MEVIQSHWYVARLVSGEADRAIEALEGECLSYSYPVGHFADGTTFPILPGYILVNSPACRDHWSFIANLRGIDRFLPIGAERPCPIPPKEFEAFHSRLDNHSYDEMPRVEVSLPWFKKNEVVMINDGPFASHTGLFKFVKRGKVYLSVAIFGATFDVAFNGHQVSKQN